ncbi:dihydropteroate synthase [Paraliomyxa miuraensis]|uniref:dihydropteroate synthase n=1 Tax=Paraliomyxa miuraensis TaxID=376150 RepID=UPI002254A231|nr:dihydropteroate synthase [Paraliomyxa miuraensis]MCX4244606.1 dihydropteroate synthase [Paraliomyxa miuraensis]
MTDGDVPSFLPGAWVHARGVIGLRHPQVMAIINATPDSFFDGGRLHDGLTTRVDAALEHARRCVAHGADILDVGGESTRPGAPAVDPKEERVRVVTLLEALRSDPAFDDVPISIDTRRASVAEAALKAGASIVNDVSGLADPGMIELVAREGAGLVIGHLRGEPRTMQREIQFAHVLREVTDELAARVDAAVAGGVERPRIVVDPGIGFGKTAEQSAALVAASGWLRQATGCPVLIGASRKSFLAAITGGFTGDRLAGSLAAALVAVERGASVLRVHDVGETVQALVVARSIRRAFETLAEGRAPREALH